MILNLDMWSNFNEDFGHRDFYFIKINNCIYIIHNIMYIKANLKDYIYRKLYSFTRSSVINFNFIRNETA